jgi:hypothetical protein
MKSAVTPAAIILNIDDLLYVFSPESLPEE